MLKEMPQKDERVELLTSLFQLNQSVKQEEIILAGEEIFSHLVPEYNYSYSESFPQLTPERREQVITSMLALIKPKTKIHFAFTQQIFDLISQFPDSLSEPSTIKLLKILGYSKDDNTAHELRHQALQLVIMLISINKIPFPAYRFLYSASEQQTNEQFMAAIYLKLQLRFSNYLGFFFALDRDYQHLKSNENKALSFLGVSPESAKIARYAHQEVLAILKTLESSEKRLNFLNQISDLALFENYNNYKNYSLGDKDSEILVESVVDKDNCTIS